MATKSPKNAPVAPIVAPELPAVGKFIFKIDLDAPIPQPSANARAANPNALPFKDWFAVIPPGGSVYIPQSFWTAPKADGGREGTAVANASKAAQYAKAKVRDAFNSWQAADKEARSALRIQSFTRKKGDVAKDGAEPFPEDGISVFILAAEPAKETPPADPLPK